MMRILLILALVSAAACAKKQVAPKTPETTSPKSGEAGAPGNAPDSGADEKAPDDLKGDPCDGGETK